ncbi:MAG: UvrD-helicase domain-containing protein [Candidatus Vogelbacteria bacterium]|nr:UvrD-helicase domain-containing protein [Candidatus Vogelbacteria bacterium]
MHQALTELNQAQRRAALHRDGPLLVVAGAGAGKTRTIAYRIFQLIASGIAPHKILAVTFTNKAAREMLERVIKLSARVPVWPSPGGPSVSTFHTLGASILRDNAQALGFNRHFTILDQDDSLGLIKAAIKESGLNSERFEPRQFLRLISREKGRGITLKRYVEAVIDDGPASFWPRLVRPVWERYEQALRRRLAFDFDDLLLWPLGLLETRPEILAGYRERWRYLLIDEYQDTNFIQYQLARLLAGPRQNICAVGDLDQAIYSWRGADCRHLRRFADDYPGATIITLEENYRSTKAILAAANQIISKNLNRLAKTLFTNRPDGEKIDLAVAVDERQEAAAVAARLATLLEAGEHPEKMAVLYRANFQSRVMEEAMLKAGVPYRVLGTRFFERQEIKDILAYLKAALNPADFESLKRALGAPARGLGKVALAKILSGQADNLPVKQRRAFHDFQKLLTELAELAQSQPVSKVLSHLIRVSGFGEALVSGSASDRERLENIQELVTLALKYDELPPAEAVATLLADVALVSDQDSLDLHHQPAVNLMTVHAAKGLEFNRVFVIGLEQALFPHERFGAVADPDYDPEEERRLFYVALTRARDKLYLSYAETRTIYGSTRLNQPSEFLQDLDPALFEETIYAG